MACRMSTLIPHRYLINCFLQKKLSHMGIYSQRLILSQNLNQHFVQLHNFSARTIPVSKLPLWKPNTLVRDYPTNTSCRQFRLDTHARVSTPLIKGTGNHQQERLVSQMNIRLVNENSFLSWCRNAYLSTVVGVAMITEATTALGQGAGIGALVVGTMNLFWGTGCHISNLIRLRHASGMSGFTLSLHVLGSFLHCLLWGFVLVCYIGFLDETLYGLDQKPALAANTGQGLDNRLQKRGMSDI